MAGTLPKVENTGGGIEGIVQLFNSLGPLLGSGKNKTTSTSTTSSDPATNTQADELIKKIMEGVSPENLDVLEGNTIERARQAFAPNNISPNAAGIRGYSDTVNSSLRNEAMARASAEAMTARLAAINAAQKTASSVVETKLQTNKVQQQQQAQQTGPNKAGQLLSLATPLAIGYNALKKGTPARSGVSTAGDTSPIVSDPSTYSDSSSPLQLSGPGMDGTGGGFPVQDFGNDSLILNSNQSDVPLPLDFSFDPAIDSSAAATDIPIDGSVATDIPSDLPSVDTTPIDIPVDSASDPSIWDNISGFFGFADGGVIPAGRRPIPSSYDENALPGNQGFQTASLFRDSTDAPTPTSVTSDKLKNKVISTGPGLPGPSAYDELIQSGDTSPPAALGESVGPAPAGIGTGLGLLSAVIGAVPAVAVGPVGVGVGLVASLMALAANSGIGVDTSLGEAVANDPEAGVPGGPDDPGADAGNTSGPGTSPDSPDSSSPGSDDSGDSGGSSSDSGGDGGFTSGGEISGNKMESTGIDKKLIRVTPGEYVIPKDTVDILGEDFLDMLVERTHTPIRRGVR